MDTLRGNFNSDIDPLDSGTDPDSHEDDTGREDPPAVIGTDERRMQVRAYNHWAGLLEDRNFPSIEDLEPDALPDFGPYSVLLDFSTGVENPGISYLGAELAQECDANTSLMSKLDDIPARSLLSRITDHYMQILANQAPIGFEAEFVNQRDQTILYRGILLPFSSDDDTIDFIYGIINWKELADPATADELLLQIDQALGSADNDLDLDEDENGVEAELDADLLPGEKPAETGELTDWADGPASPVVDASPQDGDGPPELADEQAALPGAETETDEYGLPLPAYGALRADNNEAPIDDTEDTVEDELDYAPDSDFALDDLDDEEEPLGEEYGVSDEEIDTGSFASLTEHLSGLGSERTKKTATELGSVQPEPGEVPEPFVEGVFDLAAYGLNDDADANDEDLDDGSADDSSFGSLGALLGGDHRFGTDGEDFDNGFDDDESLAENTQDDAALEDLEGALELTEFAQVEEPAPLHEPPIGNLVAQDMELGDWLAVAREQAEAAQNKEDRSRAALYEAVGRAYDFAVAARESPEDFAELVEDSGLTMQERAPMTPVVKLVFGADYDKTRVTEYAAVLTHAARVGVEQGDLAGYIAKTDGGLKSVVAAERAWRREQDGRPVKPASTLSPALTKKLRALPAQEFSDLSALGEEFSLVAVRRMPDGTIAMLGEVPHDAPLVTKAARALLDK